MPKTHFTSRSILILLLVAALPAAEKPKLADVQIGHVVSQDFVSHGGGAYAAPIGRGVIAVPINFVSNVVTVDVGNIRLTWVESRNRHPLILTVNADVAFTRDKQWYVVVDESHKKHTFSITSSTKMAP